MLCGKSQTVVSLKSSVRVTVSIGRPESLGATLAILSHDPARYNQEEVFHAPR
jgi:hypothetical protein